MNFDHDQQLAELRETLSIMELMCNSIDESIVLLNKDNEIKWCNTIFDALVGKPHITILGEKIFSVFEIHNVKPIDDKTAFSLNLNLCDDKWIVEEFKYIRDMQELYLQVSITKCQGHQEALYVCVIRDITEQKKLHQQLEHLAHYDLLTNLPNRLQLRAYFKREVSRAKRHNRQLAIFFIDIDKFKFINDTYGHAAGDLFLKIVSERMQATLRDEDFVARYSGDEFVVVISEFDDKVIADKIAGKIRASLSSPYSIFGNIIKNTASIGISFYPFDGESMNDLIGVADKRMYDEKKLKTDSNKTKS